MNKLSWIFLVLFSVLSASVFAAPLTVVSGLITDQNSDPVVGAEVTVVCTHNSVPTTKLVSSGANGKYYAFFLGADCAPGDTAVVTAKSGDAENSNSGTITYNENCRINVGLINVQIPEFGVIAGGVALAGAIAGLVIIRRKN